MEVIIRPNEEEAALLTALLAAKAIKEKPNPVMGLATGRTMEGVYSLLVELHQKGELDFSRVTTFNLDEYVGLDPTHEQSYRHYMEVNLFQRVNIDPANTHLPNGVAADLDAECAAYEDRIRDSGGIDFQLLGIGRTGHIGFNEPLSAMFSRTRVKALTPETVAQNGPLFGDPARMPRRALTMGVGTILDARRCVLLATGSEKADVIAKAVEGPITSMISASALQMHPRCTVIVDEAAAVHLRNQEYYHWIFNNEPEWDEFR